MDRQVKMWPMSAYYSSCSTAFSLLVVMVIQKPGVKNKAYSQKHGIADVQNEYRRIADQTERDFSRKYPIVGIIVGSKQRCDLVVVRIFGAGS